MGTGLQLNLDVQSKRQLATDHRASRKSCREMALIFLIECGEMGHIRKPYRDFHHLFPGSAAGDQRSLQIVQDQAGLGGDIPMLRAATVIHRNLAREKQKTIGRDRFGKREGQFSRVADNRVACVEWTRYGLIHAAVAHAGLLGR